MAQKYTLRINAEINETDPYGGFRYGQGFRIAEEVSFEADSFLKIAAVLGKFHALSEEVKADE